MDHHHLRRHHHHQHQQHHHHPPRQHHPQLIDSSSSSSSRYLPLRPPPPPSFPDDHPNLFPPPPQRHLPPPPPLPQHHPLSPRPPCLLHHPPPPPFRPPPPPSHLHHKPLEDLNFVNSPPHHHNQHHHNHLHHLQHRRALDGGDDHRDLFRSPPRVIPPNRVVVYENHHNLDDVDHRTHFRLSELPLPPPPPPSLPASRVPPLSPVGRRSPPQFIQFDRIRREHSPSRFREDLNLESHVRLRADEIEYQLHRDRIGDRRISGVFDRLEGDFNRDHDHDHDRDRHERYHPEMVMRKEMEVKSGNRECRRGPSNDEVLMRGGRDDVVLQENVNVRRGSGSGSGSGGGGSRELSRSPIKFRSGGVEVDDEKSNRGRKEEIQECSNRGTSKKNVQKKSAFLRIQPGKQQQHNGSFRNRFDNSNTTPSPHKVKESNSEFIDRRISEERVRNPVELDVSFKSNALVAKPVMAAPSWSGVVCDVNNSLSDSGIRIDGETFRNNSSVSKREEKDFKNRVRVSSIMKRLGTPNNVEVRGSHSESSLSGFSSLSGRISAEAALKGEVLGKDDKNAGFDSVSSSNVRKKRKVISPLSRLSRSVPTKTDSGLVHADCSANHPSDGTMPSDISVEQSEKEFSGNFTALTQNVSVDMHEVDISKPLVVVDQEEVITHSVSEASISDRMRETGILEYLPDSQGSLGTGFVEGHDNMKGFSQDEQRISNPDEDVTKAAEKCSSDIQTEKDSVKGQDIVSMSVNKGSEEISSELMVIGMGDNVDNNDNCCGNVDTFNSAAVMKSISVAANVSNKKENKLDLMSPVVDPDKPSEIQVFSSPENATIGLSLGGLYSDRNYEPESRYFEDHAKLGSFSVDESSDKRNFLSHDDDVTISLKHINNVSADKVMKDFQEKHCQGSDTTLTNADDTLGREENSKNCLNTEGVIAFSVERDSSLPNRKRKVGTVSDSLDSRISESCHESAVSVSFPTENAMLSVENHSSAASGAPCVKSDVSHGNEFTGSHLKGLNSSNHFHELDPIEHFSGCDKKRKILPLESVFSDAPGSESSDLPVHAKTLVPVADGSSVIYSPQLAEGFGLQKSVITGKDVVDKATISLCAETFSSADNSISDSLCTDSCLSITKSTPPDAEQSDLPESGCNRKVDGNLMTAGANDETGLIVLESACIVATNDRDCNLQCLPTDHTGDAEQGPLAMKIDFDDTIPPNANLSSLSGCLLSCAESTCGGVTTNSDLMDPPNLGLPGACSLFSSTLDTSIPSPVIHVISGEKLSKDDKQSIQPFATQSSFISQANLLSESHKNNSKPGSFASLDVQSSAQKSVSVPSKQVKTTMSSSNSMIRKRRNVLTHSKASPSTSHHSSGINSSNKTQTFLSKPRTWHRTSNLTASNILVKKPSVGTPASHRALLEKAMKVKDTSYIRKGNSLVRNPVSGAATSCSLAFGLSIDRSKSNKTDRIEKMVGSVMIESTELPDGIVRGGRNPPIEMPKTPPLPCSGKTSDNDVVYSGECTSSLHVDQFEGTDNEEAGKSSDAPLDSFGVPQTSVNRNLEDPGILSDGDLLGLSSKRMMYIKRKSNQLIAASKTSQLSNTDKATATCSDTNYYKRRKNQLIRASSEGSIQKMIAVNEDSSKSLTQRALHVHSGRSSSKRLSNKVKSPKLSLVWKLGDTKSCGKVVDALRPGSLLSHLLPWKRATYWSRKLLTSRKRGAVYVRSGRGFSLKRSKVISLPGTSLKWSKSMEKRSKKVEEEASLAVAALDSVEKSGSSGVSSKAESSIYSSRKLAHGLKLHPGERIFRIGVFRYRMDPSRRTLQRISDEEASDFSASKTEKNTKRTYVPKRLLIGSDEYVRIGNGNQLVRDPKRRTRILASEKVRWSLHTARMRLAKKRKFCQFFTRFGKCNKGEGKCSFIHDPTKIVVCTKFLNGLCADHTCKLTHKVIPERMPDCSFFLQGLCSNEKCPYRHVNVNPKASICDSFLRGYCAEGNECRKKHSYICPEFEASGSCPQGLKCKLYHPKKGKAKRRKVLRDQKNAKGRYFGTGLSVVADPEARPVVLEKHAEPNKVSVVFQGELGDFVSLDVSDDEAQEDGQSIEQTFLSEDGLLNSQLDDLDYLIKPLGILGRL